MLRNSLINRICYLSLKQLPKVYAQSSAVEIGKSGTVSVLRFCLVEGVLSLRGGCW